MDDGLQSEESAEEAKNVLTSAKQLCALANLKLHKVASNSKEVLDSVHPSERATKEESKIEDSVFERALGIQWSTKNDTFKFQLDIKSYPATRRGILAATASVFDPIGLVSPLVLKGRLITQALCRENLTWDESIPSSIKPAWDDWLQELELLKSLEIPRCLRPLDFGKPVSTELHHFCDASFKAYGCCSYVRFTNKEGNVHCSLVASKARVAPLKPVSMPRLELQAAVLASKMSTTLSRELDYKNIQHHFWSDSKVALAYIQNDSTRFQIYVANRVEIIRQNSSPDHWKYVPTEKNPADHASRGLTVEEMKNSNWFTGPDFLWEKEVYQTEVDIQLPADDPEIKVKSVNTFASTSSFTSFEERFQRFSSLSKLISALSVLIRRCATERKLSLSNLELRDKAKLQIIKLAQQNAFKNKLQDKNHPLKSLDPFYDKEGILRVGGRLKNSLDSYETKHPAILPKSSHISYLMAKATHEKTAHQGRNFTINNLRTEGIWIVSCRSVVSSLIHKCVTCIKLRGKSQLQHMSNLPTARVEPSPPFTHCGIDVFGPFTVYQGRKEVKRYGLIFTCLALRAVHIELLDDLSTDAFINALRSVFAIRGNIRTIYCDNGTNFKGAANELQAGIAQLDKEVITSKALQLGCQFMFNPPLGSHMGGVWERQIRTARCVLAGLLSNSGGRLDTSSLRTLMYEVAGIINSRPLTVDSLASADDPVPLSPNHLLTMKGGAIFPPPGKFVKEDVYLSKRWRKVQFLADQFWSRWKKEYLQSLQVRSKWQERQPNLKKGDVVIMQDDSPRCLWKLARILDVMPGSDGLVRKVQVLVSTSKLDSNGKAYQERSILERPIHKLVLLHSSQQAVSSDNVV